MNTLMKSSSSKTISELISEHIALFISFEHVYLFGSVLECGAIHNDIDILVIYKQSSSKLINDIQLISEVLGKASGMLIDITALSVEEEKDTAFLEKIKPRYMKLK